METTLARVSDVHARALTHGLQPLEDLDVRGAVGGHGLGRAHGPPKSSFVTLPILPVGALRCHTEAAKITSIFSRLAAVPAAQIERLPRGLDRGSRDEPGLEPHRHHDVRVVGVLGTPHDPRPDLVGEAELDHVPFRVHRQDVQQVARVEADRERLARVLNVDLLRGLAPDRGCSPIARASRAPDAASHRASARSPGARCVAARRASHRGSLVPCTRGAPGITCR